MNTSKVLFKPIWQVICFYLFISQISIPGVTLCIGADGHFGLESAPTELRCGSLFPINTLKKIKTPLSNLSTYSDKGHCGPCIDVSLSTENFKEKLNSLKNLETLQIKLSAIFTFLNPHYFLPESYAIQNHTQLNHDAFNLNLVLIQSVTLIC
jgi:hypothetical protein